MQGRRWVHEGALKQEHEDLDQWHRRNRDQSPRIGNTRRHHTSYLLNSMDLRWSMPTLRYVAARAGGLWEKPWPMHGNGLETRNDEITAIGPKGRERSG